MVQFLQHRTAIEIEKISTAKSEFPYFLGKPASACEIPVCTDLGMPTKNRIFFCGATYHVMARGNRKQMIFTDARDRRQFLKIVAVALKKFDAECYAYSLMGNHYHLIVHTPLANLAMVMHCIDSAYARYVNWRHRLTGHLFEGPYTASERPRV
jgi:REP element-mobilizing transposase RayT